MAVCGIDDDAVDLGSYKRFHALENIRCHADAGAAEKTAALILGRIRILDLLLDILDGDQTLEIKIIIDNREFLFTSLAENLLRFLDRDAFLGRDQAFGRHALPDLLAVVLFEKHITVGENADQLLAFCDRHTGDPELRHQIICILQCIIR